MRFVRLLLPTVFLIIISTSTVSATLITQHLTDPEFGVILQLLVDNAFKAEGRIGDLSGAATYELDVGPEFGNPVQTAQFNWPNGGAVPFTLTYNGQTNLVSFFVGGITLTYSPAPPFTDLFVRTRAVNDNSSIIVYDMVLDGETVGADASASGPDGAQTLWIKNGQLNDGFVLTGTAMMSWTGTTPSQSRLAFQIKAGYMETVPSEESTWGRAKALFE